MTKNIFAIFILTLIGSSAIAQEILSSPISNPALTEKRQSWKATKASTSAIKLPFYDDFSSSTVFPSPIRWADTYAFINTDFAKYPPSVGVATLDVINEKGVIYPGAGPNPFDADKLTSLPIRLDSVFTPAKKAIMRRDSVYLSFYYQPQGRSISPPSEDASLLLEFHSPGEFDTITSASGTIYEPKWRTVWTMNGGAQMQVDQFASATKRYFRQILIPITDSAKYFKNGFQFRFRNIATLKANDIASWRSNGSNWNVDVVSLSTGRSIKDTVTKDIAFAEIAPSMLRNYESMPFRQYRNNFVNEMEDTLDIKIANLDKQNQNISYKYSVRKNSLAPFKTYDGGNYFIKPYSTSGYLDYPLISKPIVNFFYPISNEEKIVFHIIHTITPDQNPAFQSNDTIRFDQLFSNYYAYDNGTPEAGIGINGVGSYAVQFKLNVADTMRGMQIYFNPIASGGGQRNIDLVIWNDALGKPGQIKQTIRGVTPITSNNLNEFTTYWFETPVVVDPLNFPSLTFYMGWSQTFVDNLNVGFDRFKDSRAKRFFNVSGQWEMSSDPNFYGSLLLRPIVGIKNPLGIDKPATVQQLKIAPNPVTDGNLMIQLPETWKNTTSNNLVVNIISATGSQVLLDTYSNPIRVNSLAPGFYMAILTDKTSGRKATGKFIIR